VRPFLRGKKLLGETGARKQLKGVTPRAEEIRVPAVKSVGLRAGSGLHELVPTNEKGKVAASGNPVLVGLQSGARTSTANQLFRDTSRDLVMETDPHAAANALLLAQLGIEPTGPDILQSSYLQGMVPNEQDIGPIGPAVTAPSPASAPDPNRLKLARRHHWRRERSKMRLRSLKRSSGRGRSPRPPREDIDTSGGGDGYLPISSSDYPVEPVPSFGDVSVPFEYTAIWALG
jgi:hypothetical protein